MPTSPWKAPVIVLLGMAGNVTVSVSDTVRAAEILLNEWPTDWGPMHLRARQACVRCLLEDVDPQEAREAFIEAAREAGILAE